MSQRPVLKPHELTEPRQIRALAHPIRMALLEALTLAGPLTATEAAERIGETATTCSFHLRQLAKYGFVEEAGGGTGRQRPWRLVRLGVRVPPLRDSPEWTAAAAELERVMVARYLERLAHWMRFRRDYPEEWRSAAASSERILFLTLQEFKAFGAEVRSLLNRHAERVVDPGQRPPDAVAVEALFFTYPIGGPGGE